jgi:hypothetical protein
MAKTLQDLMPANARKKLGNTSKLNVLSSHDVFRTLKEDKVIIMACNTRIKHVIPGIMRAAQDLDAVVCYELAKSEDLRADIPAWTLMVRCSATPRRSSSPNRSSFTATM